MDVGEGEHFEEAPPLGLAIVDGLKEGEEAGCHLGHAGVDAGL